MARETRDEQMSNWVESRKRFNAMSPRDKEIWNLAQKAVNEMGFACQLAAQGAENSQMKREAASDEAMAKLLDLLTKESPGTHADNMRDRKEN